MIRISSEVQRTAVILNAIIRTDGKASHAFRLVVIHAHGGVVELRRQAGGIRVEGMMAVLRSGQTRIVAREQEIEVFQPVKASGLTGERLRWWLRLLFVRHIGKLWGRDRSQRAGERGDNARLLHKIIIPRSFFSFGSLFLPLSS